MRITEYKLLGSVNPENIVSGLKVKLLTDTGEYIIEIWNEDYLCDIETYIKKGFDATEFIQWLKC